MARSKSKGAVDMVPISISLPRDLVKKIDEMAAADSKGKDFNKVELQYSKDAGDITIPTKGVFISTNCVETIRDSIRVDEIENLKGEK